AKKDLTIEAVRAVGGDLRYSGWKRMGKLSSGFDVVDTSVIVKPRPFGGWIVAEHGRKSTVAPKRRARAVLNTPWGPRTYTRDSPMQILKRTPAKHSLSNATERIQKT